MNQEILKELIRIGELLENIGRSLKKIAVYLNDENKNCSFDNDLELSKIKLDENVELNDAISLLKDEIIDYLEKNKFTITLIPEENTSKFLVNISKYIGEKYDYVKDFLKQIKTSLNTGLPVKMYMEKMGQEKISYICQLASNLHEGAFLENYRYFNSPKFLLTAQPLRKPLVINFINGGWLENYIVYKIETILSACGLKKGKDFDYLKNIKLKLPNGNDFELDVLFKIKDKIFWFEAKTGDYQQYVHKYSEVSKLLKIPSEQAFMVITEISNVVAEAISTLFNMTVCNLTTFETSLKNTLKKLNLVEQELQNTL